MIKHICITNRTLVEGDFLKQIERVLRHGCDMLILREKDLSETEYEELAIPVRKLCRAYDTPCILHTYVEVARRLGADGIHLPLRKLEEYVRSCGSDDPSEKSAADPLHIDGSLRELKYIGASTHSVEDVEIAEQLGANYVTAGHVFATDCKKGVSPRGIAFLQEVCEHSHVPVYAIGGIDANNETQCEEAGAAGVCMMSGYMRM